MSKSRLKSKTVPKKRKRENINNLPNQKNKGNPRKKATHPLIFAMSKSRSKFKSAPKKKRKRGNISDVSKPEKEMKPHKKNSPCNVKVQVQGHS
jgi:hypothetical protein